MSQNVGKAEVADIATADMLRAVPDATLPDPRMSYFAVVEDGASRPVTLQDRHESISKLTLLVDVPLSVRVHFETAKNLYLYSWFVYRFHAVAEQQVLVTLEFALRDALQGSGYVSAKRAEKMGLSDLLKRARVRGLVKNESLTRRQEWALELAERRYLERQVDEMIHTGTDTAIIDYSSIEPTQEDIEFDWIGEFIARLPACRNDYSHGSTTLRVAVFRTFEVVCDLINQAYRSGAPLAAPVSGDLHSG